MLHLEKKAKELCEVLKEKGFNGVRFDRCHVDIPQNDDDLPKKQFENRRRDYACFQTEPVIPMSMGSDNPYMPEQLFDTHTFFADLIAWVQKEVGEGIQVSFRESPSEWELIRPKKKKKA